jgi:hypothetical protein
LLTAAAVALFGTSAVFAQQIIVRVAPPPPIVERRPVRPGPAYVWTGGYHRWDGRAYIWVPGRWAVPPRRGGVWAWVPGHWRY